MTVHPNKVNHECKFGIATTTCKSASLTLTHLLESKAFMSVDLPDLCLPTKATEIVFSLRSCKTWLKSTGPTVSLRELIALAAIYKCWNINNLAIRQQGKSTPTSQTVTKSAGRLSKGSVKHRMYKVVVYIILYTKHIFQVIHYRCIGPTHCSGIVNS